MISRVPALRRRAALAALLGASLLGAPSAAAAPAQIRTCSTVALAEAALSACFPALPGRVRGDPDPAQRVRLWAGETKRGFYAAIDTRGTPANAAAQVVGALSGRMVATKASAFTAAPGSSSLRFWFVLDGQRSGAGVFLAEGNHLYGLMAVTDRIEEAMAARFIASLSIPASAKAGENLLDRDGAAASAALSPAGEMMRERVATALRDRATALGASSAAPVAAPSARPQQVALADTNGADDIPDPHADLRGAQEPRRSPPREPARDRGLLPPAQAPAASLPASPRPIRVPSDPLPPALLADPPSPHAVPSRPPSIGWPTAGAADPPAPAVHRIWLPSAWRWNGYSWEWLPGRWDRARD